MEQTPESRALEDLDSLWGDEYDVGFRGGRYFARRVDGTGRRSTRTPRRSWTRRSGRTRARAEADAPGCVPLAEHSLTCTFPVFGTRGTLRLQP